MGQAFFHMFVPTSAYAVGTDYPTSASAERATPIPHSLTFNTVSKLTLASSSYMQKELSNGMWFASRPSSQPHTLAHKRMPMLMHLRFRKISSLVFD